MSLLKVLRMDHALIRDAYHQLILASHRDTDTRSRLFMNLKNRITRHTDAEEQTLYSALSDDGPLHGEVTCSYDEHHRISEIIDEMSLLSTNDPLWNDELRMLGTRLEAHFDRIETRIFPDIRRVISSDQLEDLANVFLRIRDFGKPLLTGMHPLRSGVKADRSQAV